MLKHFFAFLVLAVAVSSAFAQTPAGSSFTARELAQGYREGYVLAKPHANRLATVDADEDREGMTRPKKFARLGGLRLLKLRAGETTQAAVARLAATGRYDFVEPDRIRHALAVPSDTDFSQQWALNNTGSNGPASGIAGADIHAEAGWDIRTDASSVIVAVVDSGALLTHTDLIPNLWQNPTVNTDGYTGDLNGINLSGNSASTGNPNDDNGHGTHVSGIVGAINNGNATSGVAWKTQLMELKFLDASGGGSTSEEVTCLEFAVAHHANVVNASFGSTGYSNSEYLEIQALGNAGIIFVAAAGNNATDNDLSPTYPASYPLDNIVTVACSDNRDDSVFFTCYGSGIVDLYAPGYDILSLYNNSTTATAVLSGTSMSTPAVTGTLALLKAQFPTDTYRQLINRVLNGVDPNSNFTGKSQTGGRLNLANALNSATSNTPFNDHFASRAHLAGADISVRSNNVGSTLDAGEPTIAANAGGASLWWDWTAPATGTVILSTGGSAYPTLLAAYTGTSVNALTSVAASTIPSSLPGGAQVTFTAQAGTTYEITIDGQNSGSGAATGLTLLNINYANDAFETPITLSGPSVGITGSNTTATLQSSEPRIAGDTNGASAGHSVWYAWTAPKSAQFQISAFSFDFDPLLAVYTGSSRSSLTSVASSVGSLIGTSAGTPASLCTSTFNATAGTTYYITIDGNVDANLFPQQPDPQALNTGQFTLSIDDSRWQAVTADSITCSPTVGSDGTVYVGSNDDYFYAYNPNGSLKWRFNALGLLDTSAASLSSDGTAVYFGSSDGKVYALSTATGLALWSYTTARTTALSCAPTVAADGTIYIKDEGNNLYALTAGGTLKWTTTVPGISYAAPVIAPDGTIYMGSDNTTFYAIKPADGSLKWVFNQSVNPSSIYTSAAIDSSGNIYFGTIGGTFYALSPASGAKLWSYTAGNSITSSPALNTVNGQQYVYFGSYDHHLYALNTSNGAVHWTYTLPDEVRASSPAIDANGVVYIGCYDNNLYAINPDGTLNRTFATGDWVRSSPVIFDTTLYFGSNDHKLYAFDIGAGSAGSVWPMYLYNSRRLGRAVVDPLAITVEPAASTPLGVGSPLTLSVAATGPGPLSFQWYLNNAAISGAINSTYAVPSATLGNAGNYTVIVSDGIQSVTSTADSVDAPVFTIQPLSQIMAPGTSAAFNVSATLSPTYQWYFNGNPISGAINPLLFVSHPTSGNAGTYTCVATSGGVATTSAAATLAFQSTPTPGYLTDISARAFVGSGANVLITGFGIAGSGTKKVLLHGVGPSLQVVYPGVFPNYLANPQIGIYNNQSAQIFQNTSWNSDAAIASADGTLGAFPIQSGSADSALLVSLSTSPAPANYTSILGGVGGTTGIALNEIYDADSAAPAVRLINISARANILTGANILIGGFVIGGSTSETVLVRAIGPGLVDSNQILTGTIAQPTLTLYDVHGNALYSNTIWGGNSDIAAVSATVGAFGLNPAHQDSVLLLTLPPGAYTAQVSGVAGGTGIGLVEVYEVQ